VLIQDSIKDKFLLECKKQIKTFFTDDASSSDSYGRIVNEKHFERLVSYIENAKSLNATIEIGGTYNKNEKYIEPTIISNLKPESNLLNEEIFGPIMPIVTFNKLDEAIDYINKGSKPLALYIYSKSKKAIKKIINNTRAGSTCINNNVVQYTNHHLPFGGSNTSGIGKSHGVFGFKEFSNERSVVKQHTKGSVELLFPPYNSFKQKLVDLTIKWF
jgi:aldehyde dehydrogenase (NAD+)